MSENEEKHEEQDEKQNASILDVNVNTEKQDEDPAEEAATAEKDAAETRKTGRCRKRNTGQVRASSGGFCEL